MIFNNETDKLARKELLQLQGKDFKPTEPDVLKRIARTLVEDSADHEHMKRIVENILQTPGNYPQVTDIHTHAFATATSKYQPDPECKRCGGSGSAARVVGGSVTRQQCRCKEYGLDDCVACNGTGYFDAVTGAMHFVSKCGCWKLRPYGVKPWLPEAAIGS
jgi:hypothetical protein